MFQYHCLNPIAEKGLGLFDEDYKKTEELEGTDAILVRSKSIFKSRRICIINTRFYFNSFYVKNSRLTSNGIFYYISDKNISIISKENDGDILPCLFL